MRSRIVPSALAGRVKRRVLAEAWIIDAARRHPKARELRGVLERQRSRRVVAEAGSVEAALDLIVDRAIARGRS